MKLISKKEETPNTRVEDLLKKGNLVEGKNSGDVYLVIKDPTSTPNSYLLVTVAVKNSNEHKKLGETHSPYGMAIKDYRGKISMYVER